MPNKLLADEAERIFARPRTVVKFRIHCPSGEIVECEPERCRYGPAVGTFAVVGQSKEGQAAAVDVGPMYIEVLEVSADRQTTRIRCFYRAIVEIVSEPREILLA